MTELYTSRYQVFRTEHGIPVRTTAGNPRFQLGYTLAASWPHLGPDGAWLKLPRPVFTARYQDKLDRQGARTIWEAVVRLSAAHGMQPVVLLCFCDLAKAGVWCHRRIFADWFTERTGMPVPELTPAPPRPAATVLPCDEDTGDTGDDALF